jgi:hypothetical protein
MCPSLSCPFLSSRQYLIVECLRQAGFAVGMTGDGVNDAPALKKADVGIAVAGATDAARAAADIVLTDPGLGVVIHAIIIARQIFQRVKNFINCECARRAAAPHAEAQCRQRCGACSCHWTGKAAQTCKAAQLVLALLLFADPAVPFALLLPPRCTCRPYRGHPAAAPLLLHRRLCL